MINLDKKFKECMKPHMLAHSVSGLGVGFILIALVPSLASMALVIGIIALIGGVAWDMSVNK